jgi:hypothetical protein
MTDRDEQDQAEMLDPDEIDPAAFPPDRPTGVDNLLAEDVTAADEYAPDSVRSREWREEPELTGLGTEPEPVPHLTDTGEPAEDDDDVFDRGGVLTEAYGGDAGTEPAEEAAVNVVGDDGPLP